LKKQLIELLIVFLREACELDPHPLLIGVAYRTFRVKRNSGARHPQNQARAGWQPVICAAEHPAEADHGRDALHNVSILASRPETRVPKPSGATMR